MKIKIDDIIEKYGMDYNSAINLDMEGRKEISLKEAMNLQGRGIIIDKEQDIYTNDLPHEERKSSVSMIFEFLR